MSNRKWNPWPWEYFGGMVKAQDGRTVADVRYRNGPNDGPLIAAAPELYEALDAALEWIDAVPSDTRLPAMPGFDRDAVDAALAKARGEA